MTGTKVIKLMLEAGGSEKLPALKETIVDAAIAAYLKIASPGVVLRTGDLREEYFSTMKEATSDLNVNSRDLQRVYDVIFESRREERDFSKKAGFFLSALIDNSSHNAFDITSAVPLDFIGFKLGVNKKLTLEGDVGKDAGMNLAGGEMHVHGNAGEEIGREMKLGKITVDGSVSGFAGYLMAGGDIMIMGNGGGATGDRMSGGNIHVKGNTGVQTGVSMTGGTIRVEGNAGRNTGDGMRGGAIYVGGNIEDISKEYVDGEIWEAGVLKRPRTIDKTRRIASNMLEKGGDGLIGAVDLVGGSIGRALDRFF
ncbi:MAG: hypothetical protein V1921_06210 [Candidatus Altiarchaeota archaeon]